VGAKERRMKTSKKAKSSGESTKKRGTMSSIDYKDDFLLKDLQNLDKAADYLTAAIDEGEAAFLLAVRDVAEAQGGLGSLSDLTNLNRENLYNMLSEKGNPRLTSLTSIIAKLGFEIKFSPRHQGSKRA